MTLYFVDSTPKDEGGMGDDRNDGLSPLTPVFTIAEALRRGGCPVVRTGVVKTAEMVVDIIERYVTSEINLWEKLSDREAIGCSAVDAIRDVNEIVSEYRKARNRPREVRAAEGLNLCSVCEESFATCPACPDDVKYGNGVGKDNVWSCTKFVLRTGMSFVE